MNPIKHCMQNMLFLLSALVISNTLASCLRADWPEFRGPTKDGITPSQSLPITWSNTANAVWRTEVPGEGWSSPVVVGDSVYLTTAVPRASATSAGGYDLKLLILDANSGEITRDVSLFSEPPGAPNVHRKNSHASPTPVFDGERLFVHFGHQGTACLTKEGDVVWKNDALAYPPVHGNGGSPAVVGDLLIFSRDGADISQVTALHKSTGSIAWQTEREIEARKRFSFCTPLTIQAGGRTQLILPGSNVVQSLDPVTGAEIWRLRYEGYSVIPRPIYHAGLVFVCTGYDRPSLLAIDPTGTGDVTDSHLAWSVDSNIPHTPSLVAHGGTIIGISDKGIACGFEVDTGRQLWQRRIDGNFSASPLLAGERLYLLSEDGLCTVLDLTSTPPEPISKNAIEERCLSSLAVVDNDLLLRSANALYRISAN